MNENIISFLLNQNVVTICCTSEDGGPYCFPCFFAFNSKHGLLYFKTSPSSYHSSLLANKPEVAGSILPDKLNILALKGVQFEGTVLPRDHYLMQHSAGYYYQKYPMALVIPGELYAIELTGIKMTDGAKGFGKKIIWKRTETGINHN